MNVHLRFLAILLGAACLPGCVTFEHAPAALTCDARLVGRWAPIANTEEESATLTKDDYAQVDPQCRVTLSFSQTHSGPFSTVQVDARGFNLDGQHYLALGDADLAALLARNISQDREPPQGLKDRVPTQAVTLVRYQIEEDVISFALLDYGMVERLVKEKALDASSQDQTTFQFKGNDEHLRRILREYPELFKQDSRMTMPMRRTPMEPRS